MNTAAARTIFFYMHDFSGGGVERMRLRLIPALHAAGHHVTLVVQHCRGDLMASWPAALELIDLRAESNLRAIPKLAALLRARRPDALISSLDHNNIAAAVATMISGARTRLIACQHNTISQEFALGLKYRLVPPLYRLLSPWVDRFVAVSDGVRSDMLRQCRLAPGKVAVIYNPVVTGADTPDPAALPPHAFYGPGLGPVFVFAGRLVAQKDPLTLLHAFAAYRATRAGKLIFLGSGPLRSQIEVRVSALGLAEDVALPGFVADVRPWLRPAAACVVPSRYEGFGNIIVEALACGTPVIAADCPEGPAEILANGEYGRLFAVGDARGCAAAMREDLRAMFPPARLRARAAKFSLAQSVAAHEALLAPVAPVADAAGASQARQAVSRAVFGLRFSRLDSAAIVQRILRGTAAAAPGAPIEYSRTAADAGANLLVTPNIEHIRLLRDSAFRRACEAATLVCADGFPVAIFAWARGGGAPRRVTGCDILQALLARPETRQRRLCFVLESRRTLEAARLWRMVCAPDAPWQFLVAPPALRDNADAASALAARIGGFAPDILIMTLGAPVSEVFAHAHRATLGAGWTMCLGQAFRVVLGLAPRAPALLRWAGLEWLWRVAHEPRRLVRRYALAAWYFPVAVVRDLMGSRLIF